MSYVRLALYPFLLSLYFVLLLLSENLGDAFFGDVRRSILILLLATGLLLLLLSGIFRSLDKAAFLASLLLIYFFIGPDLEELAPAAINQYKTALFLLGIGILVAITLIAFRLIRDWVIVNQTLNITVGIMLLLVVYRIGSYGLSDAGYIFEPTLERHASIIEGFHLPEGTPPDIYYLLVDGYARADIVRELFNYNNSEFIDFLEKTGFQVAHKSVANYQLTRLAVASMLNLDYVVDENGFTDDSAGNLRKVLTNKTFNNKVANVLREFGYRIVTIRSEGHFVIMADAENLAPETTWMDANEFETALLETSLVPRVFRMRNFRRFFRPILPKKKLSESSLKLISQQGLNMRRMGVDYVFEELARQSAGDSPMFVIGHIHAPHQPFVYGRNGETPEQPNWKFGKLEHFSSDAQAYSDQIHYLNIKLRKLIDKILANAATPPIIILQGDHGLRLTWWDTKLPLDNREELDDVCLRETFTNLNAIYLPGTEGPAAFYDSISPVNTFRLIFDNYFGSELGMVEDRTFYYTETGELENDISLEITGLQNTCSPIWEARFRALRE